MTPRTTAGANTRARTTAPPRPRTVRLAYRGVSWVVLAAARTTEHRKTPDPRPGRMALPDSGRMALPDSGRMALPDPGRMALPEPGLGAVAAGPGEFHRLAPGRTRDAVDRSHPRGGRTAEVNR